jgi:hypothetical protein
MSSYLFVIYGGNHLLRRSTHENYGIHWFEPASMAHVPAPLAYLPAPCVSPRFNFLSPRAVCLFPRFVYLKVRLSIYDIKIDRGIIWGRTVSLPSFLCCTGYRLGLNDYLSYVYSVTTHPC